MPNPPVIRTQPIDSAPSLEAILTAVARRERPVVLDSADTGPGRGRYTIVSCEPVEVAEWDGTGEDPFEAMRHKLRQTSTASGGQNMDYGSCIGWIGYFAYEAGRFIENLPATTRADVGMPIARFALYDTAAVFDALTQQWIWVAADLSAYGYKCPPIEDRFGAWRKLFAEAYEQIANPPPPPFRAIHNMSKYRYLRMIRRGLEYIAAGDIFQVNLARRESYHVQEPPINTYLRLRRTNPGAYAAFLGLDREPVSAVLSSSPELFLQLRGREVLTRPIKGTRPRSDDPATDTAYRMELATSAKDRAELAMIVDLERNDLGRVCEYGSVRVAAARRSPAWPYELETHPTVHHLVANVTGRLADKHDAIDLVRACFPGGSITGAPKVRAMEIIDELEPNERSVYTGSIGYFGLDGSMMLNIAIRTMLVVDGLLHIYTGGGIVADSVPEDEYEETRVKALGLCRALGMEQEQPVEMRSS